jgi:hypothetical protein
MSLPHDHSIPQRNSPDIGFLEALEEGGWLEDDS